MSQITLIIEKAQTPHPKRYSLNGRNAWAMHELIQAGDKGCTPIDNPAPAWAAYVQNLRAMNFGIITHREPHGGPYKGHHGRYVLNEDLKIIKWSGYDHAA